MLLISRLYSESTSAAIASVHEIACWWVVESTNSMIGNLMLTTLIWLLFEYLCLTVFSVFLDRIMEDYITSFTSFLFDFNHQSEVPVFWALTIERKILLFNRYDPMIHVTMSWLFLMWWNLLLLTGVQFASLETSSICWSVRLRF